MGECVHFCGIQKGIFKLRVACYELLQEKCGIPHVSEEQDMYRMVRKMRQLQHGAE
jgi:hypothetical protein